MKKNKVNVDIQSIKCPKCNATYPKIRIEKGTSEFFLDAWTCKNCGEKMGEDNDDIRED